MKINVYVYFEKGSRNGTLINNSQKFKSVLFCCWFCILKFFVELTVASISKQIRGLVLYADLNSLRLICLLLPPYKTTWPSSCWLPACSCFWCYRFERWLRWMKFWWSWENSSSSVALVSHFYRPGDFQFCHDSRDQWCWKPVSKYLLGAKSTPPRSSHAWMLQNHLASWLQPAGYRSQVFLLPSLFACPAPSGRLDSLVPLARAPGSRHASS